MKYPKEDKCRYCGEHIGWMLDPIGEMFGLGICGKPECMEKEEKWKSWSQMTKGLKQLERENKNGSNRNGN